MSASPPGTTVGEALAQARACGVQRLDAQLLLAKATGQSRAWVIAHEDASLHGRVAEQLTQWFARRADGVPLAYLVGEREFHGLVLQVGPDVLVPRPDTETLVDWALALLQDQPAPRVLDLGTGSGAIALALRHGLPAAATVHASDRSAAALSVARSNAARLGLAVQWHLGSWWDAVPPGPYDLVAANPPYVAPGDAHLDALRHEPATALVPDGDAGDGLADLERIAAGAAARLKPGGWLLLEHGADQAPAVRALLVRHGLGDATTRPDLAGLPRATGARLVLAQQR